MALDANGIWQYNETDAAATASDLLNLLAESTSDAIEAVNDRVDGLLPEADWATITLAQNGGVNNFKLYGAGGDGPPRYMRWGRMVQLHFVLGPNTAAAVAAVGGVSFTNDNRIGVLPAGARPPVSMTVVMAGSGSATWVLNISSDGNMYANRASAAFTTSSWMPADVCYLVAA